MNSSIKSFLDFSIRRNLRFLTPLSDMFMNDDMNLILKFIQERIHIIMSSLLGFSISMFISNIMSMNNSDILFILVCH